MKKLLLIVLAFAVTVGCVGPLKAKHPSVTDSRECAQNFVSEGSAISGKTYKTTVAIPNVSRATAMSRVTKYLTINGWQIINNDPAQGIMSFTMSTAGKSQSPMNMLFEGSGAKQTVSLSFVLGGGLVSSDKKVSEEFCRIVESVNNN